MNKNNLLNDYIHRYIEARLKKSHKCSSSSYYYRSKTGWKKYAFKKSTRTGRI